jgi:hypothetical protein
MVKKMCATLNAVKNEDCFALEKRLEACPGIVEALRKKQRSRLFPSQKTFCLFLWQVLSAERSCSEVVQAFLAWRAHNQEASASPNTAAYCQARQRLNLTTLQTAQHTLATHVAQQAQSDQRWYGRTVAVVDGTGLSMPDTPENQQKYPQAKSSKPGCGFPQMKMVALFCLTTGALLRHAQSHRKIGELTLFRRMWDALHSGDVVLADRGFCNFADYYRLRQRNIDSVMRLHQRRAKGVSLLKRLGPGDKLVLWHKSETAGKHFTKAQWAAMPDTLTVRHITFTPNIPGFRTKKITVATTLIDHKQFPASAFAELYRRRWLVELFLRDIKITLGMDILRCKTPAMVEKELTMHLIAYNLIRLTMVQAAVKGKRNVERISFKGTLQAVRQWAPCIGLAAVREREQLYQSMLDAISRVPIPNRPNRTEPRAKKRRAKNYQLMTQPRHEMKEAPHRSRYTKDNGGQNA